MDRKRVLFLTHIKMPILLMRCTKKFIRRICDSADRLRQTAYIVNHVNVMRVILREFFVLYGTFFLRGGYDRFFMFKLITALVGSGQKMKLF